MYFSKHYIPMIVKIYLVNYMEICHRDLLYMVINLIINQNFMDNYSINGCLKHLNSSMIYMKMLFRRFYPNKYSLIMNFMISFDNIILKSFLNVFAAQFSSTNFNIYNDFKNMLYVILLAQEDNLQFLKKLAKIQISFHSLIDILFFIEILSMEAKSISLVEPYMF